MTAGGFHDGFAHGMRVIRDAILGRPARHEPWPGEPMPDLKTFLDAYGGPTMTAAEFDRMEAEWLRLLADRRRLFRRYVWGVRAAGWTAILTAIMPAILTLTLILRSLG
ncbi:hypothetical protein [Bifidobacterium felsineum]|uniref:hypothetical protein n=1 Tax=Bifidobacterium felsineum TaxID=2045440 RepID=UPI001BDBBCD1|nr:hypothetical protein [Bifidobacterium felsineum]MBT1164955.1 hypothetical protein [Bifidobacterium felsineum]